MVIKNSNIVMRMFFEIIPNAPWFDIDAVKPMTSPRDDGMIRSIGNFSMGE